MARIRTIKPNFFKSQEVAKMSYRARLTWIGLWTYVDDDGRGRDDARLIKGELWPLEDDVTWQDVEEVLTELSLSLHVVRYTVENRHFLAIPKWSDHQVISRPSKSKFPAPTPENIREVAPLTEDSLSLHGTLPAGTGNREQGTGNREMELSLNATKLVKTSEPLFDSFWSIWPRGEGKADAVRAWAKAIRKVDGQTIVDAARSLAESPYRDAKEFMPHGATWLNGERWNDPLPTAPESRKETPTDKTMAIMDIGRRLQAEADMRELSA